MGEKETMPRKSRDKGDDQSYKPRRVRGQGKGKELGRGKRGLRIQTYGKKKVR